MAYATLDDLRERAGDQELRQIADRNRDGEIDSEVIGAALTDADNQINSYIAMRYTAPLASVPPIVTTWAVSIARYVLFRNGAPEHVVRDYKDTIAALKDLARGLSALPIPDGEPALPAQAGGVLAEHPARVFTENKLRGW